MSLQGWAFATLMKIVLAVGARTRVRLTRSGAIRASATVTRTKKVSRPPSLVAPYVKGETLSPSNVDRRMTEAMPLGRCNPQKKHFEAASSGIIGFLVGITISNTRRTDNPRCRLAQRGHSVKPVAPSVDTAVQPASENLRDSSQRWWLASAACCSHDLRLCPKRCFVARCTLHD